MINKGREPHSIVICGERGQGRKTLAKYIAMRMMCERGGDVPCGTCKACKMLEHDAHPDFITIRPNENGNYQVDTIRAMAADAVVKPTEADYRIFLIADLDRSVNTAVQVQNILLKLIEEPPEHCVIILTAASKQIFLPTIISRVLCLTAEPCTEMQAEEWLRAQNKYPLPKIIEAVECCHGNFGRCVEYIEGDVLPAAYNAARACTDAMIKRDEFEMLRAFSRVDGKKNVFRQTLVFLQEIARDACAKRLAVESRAGCYQQGAAALSDVITEKTAEELYELFGEYINRLDSNCNLTLAMNSLTGQLVWLICRKI